VVLKTGKKRILNVKNIDAISSKNEVEQAIKFATSDIQGSMYVVLTNIHLVTARTPQYGRATK